MAEAFALRAPGASLVPGTVYIDTETTGLGQDAEILEICVLDDSGKALVDARCRPQHAAEWPAAQEVHGIAPVDVEGCPTFAELAPAIQEHIDAASRVCVYNAMCDMGLLRRAGIEVGGSKLHDTMLDFSATQKEIDPKHGSWRWFTLAIAAMRCGYAGRPDHSAKGDCLDTRHVQAYCDAQRRDSFDRDYSCNYGELIARLGNMPDELETFDLAATLLGVPQIELERDVALSRHLGLARQLSQFEAG